MASPSLVSSTANPLAAADLAAFVATLEVGSVHGAADALDLTQSAVTKRLKSLEKRVGVVLLDRGRFGARPTAAGRLLYPEAKQALAALLRAESVLIGHLDQAGSSLEIAASHTIGEFLLPGWLGGFRASQADVRVQVEIVNSPGVLRALRDGEAEIGFVEGLDDLEGFGAVTVHRDEIAVVVAASHRWARRRAIPPKELLREPYYAREEGSGTRAVADAGLRGAGVELVAALEVASTQSVKRALAGGGFSLLSPLAIEAEQHAGSLRAVPVKGVDLTRELRAVRSAKAPLRGAAKQFWRWLDVHTSA